jgi:hypothetical protein
MVQVIAEADSGAHKAGVRGRGQWLRKHSLPRERPSWKVLCTGAGDAEMALSRRQVAAQAHPGPTNIIMPSAECLLFSPGLAHSACLLSHNL